MRLAVFLLLYITFLLALGITAEIPQHASQDLNIEARGKMKHWKRPAMGMP